MNQEKNLQDDRFVRRDRMRFIQNGQSSGLAILAIVFDVLYFVSIYKTDVGSYYYNILMGASILYNLIFMLGAFLASEGVKNYKREYNLLLVILAVLQIARIFILPMQAHGAVVSVGKEQLPAMGDGQFLFLVICLVLSAVCLAASAAINFSKCRALDEHNRALAEQA